MTRAGAAVLLAAALSAAKVSPTGKPAAPPVTAPQTRTSKDKPMTSASTCPVVFHSPRRDSALPVTTTAAGKVAWSRELGKPASVEWPPAVLTWGGAVVVTTHSEVTVVDGHGAVAWTHAKQVTTPVAIADGKLYLKSKQRYLEALGPAHERLLADAPFPGAMGGDVRVDLFWPREKDFVVVLETPGAQEVAEGDSADIPLPEPRVTAFKNRYQITYGDRLIEFTGTLELPPLFLPEQQILTLFAKEMIRVDVAHERPLSRFPLPLEHVQDWSVDTDEQYCVAGHVGARKTLLGLAADGGKAKELWRWTDADGADDWVTTQPPIQAGHGRVYALTEGRVLAFENGKLLWQYDARDAALKHGARLDDGSFEIKDGRLLARGSLRHAVALADRSLLVTGNRTLRHLDAAGHQRFSVTVDEDILSQPVVDGDGHIYVATAHHLLRID